MSHDPHFDPVRDAPLLSAYVDGELEAADRARVEAHLAGDAGARLEVERLRAFKELAGALRLCEAPPEDWEKFWENHYNRTERSLGWLLFAVGAAGLGGWGLIILARAILETALPALVKGAALAAAVGLLVLLVSVVRERVFTRKRTRYDDVTR